MTGVVEIVYEQRYNSKLSLTSALELGWWSSRPGRITHGRLETHYIGGWGWGVGPGPVRTGVENHASHRDSILGPSSP